ncbi:MAG: hypothetical protein BIFFINMI_01595 [Phycisphaerae bacterium]|nr:hypothetical protein [Phycisphaerae bacterium]
MQEASPLRRQTRRVLLAALAVLLCALAARAQEGDDDSPTPPANASARTNAPVSAADPDDPPLTIPTTLPDDADARPDPTDWHVVKRFDFDEARLGNEDRLPMYWYRRTGADFPLYAEGRWDRTFGYRSKESFLLKLNGGNVGYYYRPSTIAIAPGQDIRVEAMVRTHELRHARALLKVYFTDARRQVIDGSMRLSPLIGGENLNDRWLTVSVLVAGKFPSARFVNLEVYLLQPRLWRELDPATRNTPALIDYIDVHGCVWFDNVTIYRLPRVTLGTGQPGQMIPPGADASLTINVEGFPNQPLEAELLIRDAADRLIGHQLFTSGADDRSNERSFKWQTGKLPAGLYRAALFLYAGGARRAGLPPLLTRNLTFVQLPGDGGAPHVGRGGGFGLIVQAADGNIDEASARLLADEQADALARLPASLVKLPLWRGRMRLDQIEAADPWADQLIRRLSRQRLGLIATFGEIPEQLQQGAATAGTAQRYGLPLTILDVFAGDPTVWRPYVAAQLARYAEQIRYWQIGQENTVAFAQDPRFSGTLRGVQREFRTLLTAPTFVATWPGLYSWRHGLALQADLSAGGPGKFPADIANIFLSNRLAPDTLGDYVEEFMDLSETRPWATVQPLDADEYERLPRLADLAWRLVNASAGLAEPLPPANVRGPRAGGALFLDAPWTVRELSGRQILEPTEELLIYRTAADLLGGASFGGQMQLADGVVGLIFDRGEGDGVLAIRNEGGDPTAPIELFLGENAQRVDLWGNRTPVKSVEMRTGTKQPITAGRYPFYLDHIDPRIARMRASFAMVPAFVPSAYQKHVRKISFINPFNMPVSGKLTLHFPANWNVRPRIIPFSAQAGERIEREIEIRFPYNAEAGTKELLADMVLDADRAYRLQIASRFEFGLGDVGVRTLTQWLGDGNLLVTITVTNRSAEDAGGLDMFCFVAAPGRPRQERVIAGLLPGATVVKSFRLDNAKEMIGQSLRVGLREVQGSRVVNYAVPVR